MTSRVFKIDSGNDGLLVPLKTTAQRNAIVSPPAGMIIYNTDTSSFQIYKTITCTNYKTNSGTVDTTITSSAFWAEVMTGNCVELASMAGGGTLSSSNWAVVTGGTITIDNPTSAIWGIYANSFVNGNGIIYTVPVAAPSGLYEITYNFIYNTDWAIIDTSVSFDNGSSYTIIANQQDQYKSSFMQADKFIVRYIANSNDGGTMKIKFVANGKNASSTSYTLIVYNLRVLLHR